jgi:hypothetical protein
MVGMSDRTHQAIVVSIGVALLLVWVVLEIVWAAT